MMGKGERGGEMRLGLGGGVKVYKNTPVSSNAAMEIFFSEPRLNFMTIADAVR
jgi:hypothetical protein